MRKRQIDVQYTEDPNEWIHSFDRQKTNPVERFVQLIDSGMPSSEALNHIAKSPPMMTSRNMVHAIIQQGLLSMLADSVVDLFKFHNESIKDLAKRVQSKEERNRV